MRLNLLVEALSLAFLLASSSDAFQAQNKQHTGRSSASVRGQTRLFASGAQVRQVALERTAPREIGEFQNWAVQCGVQPDNGFCLAEGLVDGCEDWYAATSSGASRGSSVLTVPGEMILSAARIAQEFDGYADSSIRVLESKGFQSLVPQFYLFLKIVVEYERGTESPYYPWLESMPRKWNTAASMDDFCLSCLPPFIKSLCQEERDQLSAFREALKAFEYLDAWAKFNQELAKFVYNIVFTRSWETGSGDRQIIPVADMLNHGNQPNVELVFDQNGSCQVVLTEDVPPGSPLHLSYGDPTNPSSILARYGFLNEAPATYCKILFSNPSQELMEIGYDPSKMLFSTGDGSISEEVWDVMLYSRLEQKRLEGDRRAFYQAHVSGDEETKAAIHRKYLKETCGALRRHVDHILAEVAELIVKTNAFDSSKHPRLPLIKKHNDMVTETFHKVRGNLERIEADVVTYR